MMRVISICLSVRDLRLVESYFCYAFTYKLNKTLHSKLKTNDNHEIAITLCGYMTYVYGLTVCKLSVLMTQFLLVT